MSAELKPCPFCGSAAAHGLWADRRMAVRCMNPKCDAMGPSTDEVPDVCINIRRFIDQAIAAWNRRSPDLTAATALLTEAAEVVEPFAAAARLGAIGGRPPFEFCVANDYETALTLHAKITAHLQPKGGTDAG